MTDRNQTTHTLKRCATNDIDELCPQVKRIKLNPDDNENNNENRIEQLEKKISELENIVGKMRQQLCILGREFDRITDQIFEQLDEHEQRIRHIKKPINNNPTHMPYIK